MADANFCPLVRGKCKEAQCKFWGHLVGQDHNTGATHDKFDCVISFIPLLLVEASCQTRSVAAAVESTRNIMADPKGVMGAVASGLDRLASASERKMLEERTINLNGD